MQLDLSGNQLCGINAFGRGTYTAEGITAIAEALKVTGSLTSLNLWNNKIGDEGAAAIAKGLSNNGSLTEINLKNNSLGQEGWCVIFDALRDSPQSKISKWDLCNQGINPSIAKSLAAYVAVTGSLTKLDLKYNSLDESAKAALRAAARPVLKLDL